MIVLGLCHSRAARLRLGADQEAIAPDQKVLSLERNIWFLPIIEFPSVNDGSCIISAYCAVLVTGMGCSLSRSFSERDSQQALPA